ncbi:MAG: 23S rRNA (pseudouridine(1915)-N(3))-methyltransferase RlmH [Alphaproteobacteria bacterium]|nr:23S rRNA (pseudouridine(1915)-N(3))-methyltransferase RlmH [Alphaproteobacteria bacterium]
MRIDIVAVGRMKAGAERSLVDTYLERAVAMGRRVSLSGFGLREIMEARNPRAADRQRAEGHKILEHLADAGFVIALDERGAHATSRQIATRIGGLRDDGRLATTFIIGGPDGLDENVRSRADWTLALGRMSWPHQLLRVMLAEQLYRTTTILAGHPYHRD